MKKIKKSILALVILLSLVMLILITFGIRFVFLDNHINDDYSEILNDSEFAKPVLLSDTPVIKLTLTCGYATIQWMTKYFGHEITEDELIKMNDGKVTTSLPEGFKSELSKQLGSGYKVTNKSNLTNKKILTTIYTSLQNDMPVPIIFATIDDWNKENYTLHYSVVTGMDLGMDKVYVSNVFGYEEAYTVSNFLDSLKFNKYTNMPVFIKIGMFFSVFDKNTIFLVEKQ